MPPPSSVTTEAPAGTPPVISKRPSSSRCPSVTTCCCRAPLSTVQTVPWFLPSPIIAASGTFGSSGSNWSSTHTGLDFAAPYGTPIHAIARGTVTSTAWGGAYGNRTIITLEDGTSLGESPLVGSAKNQANFTVFYENEKLLLRASYNRRGEVVQGLVNGLNVYEEPYQQIDLNAAYNFTPALSLTASVLNLTEEETRSHLGNDTKARFYTNSYAGRVMYLGMTWKF